jgi:predicted methyltransferase
MLLATELAHLLLRQSLRPGDWAVDATVGNGHDTRFLADCVGETGRVFGFDVQAAALARATERTAGLPQVTLFQQGHEQMATRLPPDAKGRLAAVMFNLGYLPGADRDIVTRAATTLAALAQALDLIAVRGQISVIVYTGHPGGDPEAEAVRAYAQALQHPFAVTRSSRFNARRPAPELLLIERVASP